MQIYIERAQALLDLFPSTLLRQLLKPHSQAAHLAVAESNEAQSAPQRWHKKII